MEKFQTSERTWFIDARPTIRCSAAGHRGCNRRASWPPSLGRSAASAAGNEKLIRVAEEKSFDRLSSLIDADPISDHERKLMVQHLDRGPRGIRGYFSCILRGSRLSFRAP